MRRNSRHDLASIIVKQWLASGEASLVRVASKIATFYRASLPSGSSLRKHAEYALQEEIGYKRYLDFCKLRHHQILLWVDRIEYLFSESTVMVLGPMGKGHFVTQDSYPIGIDSSVSVKELVDFLEEESVSYEVAQSGLSGHIHDVIFIRDTDYLIDFHILSPILIEKLGSECTPINAFRELIFD